MSDISKTQIQLSTSRSKISTATNYNLDFSLQQNSKQVTEFDRTLNVNLQDLYNSERQSSSIFRPNFKLDLLFYNAYTGSTNYNPYEITLYTVNEGTAAYLNCSLQNNNNLTSFQKLSGVVWSGMPQYHEFDIIRDDYDISGYTSGENAHIKFNAKSATTYNWNLYLSYPFSSTTRFMTTYMDTSKSSGAFGVGDLQWNSNEGIPFRITEGENEEAEYNGQKLIRFECPIKHNLSPGEYVYLKIYEGQNINSNQLSDLGTFYFQVFTLGNGDFGTEDYIFNIKDLGYTANTFTQNNEGVFKRVISLDNTGDTTSKYYVRLHKIISNLDENVLNKIAFEQNIFGISKKFESSATTANYKSRVSIREGAKTYSYSINKDIDINQYIDNLKRPISELYLTTIWKGFFGWTYNGPGNSTGMKRGWEFNLGLRPSIPAVNNIEWPVPQSWWGSNNSLNSSTGSTTINSYTKPDPNNPSQTLIFKYFNSLNKGDIIDGDFCEWNDSEQKERVISEIYHKFYYNPSIFNFVPQVTVEADIGNQGFTTIVTSMTQNNVYTLNPYGFYYSPHHSMKIREFSEYIETADPSVVDIPNYAYYSTKLNVFLWREFYEYGFNTSTSSNPNYPFLNNAHYPTQHINLRLIPEGSNYPYTIVTSSNQPTTDFCE